MRRNQGPRPWLYMLVFVLADVLPSYAFDGHETKAKQAFMIEAGTGTVLIDKNSDAEVSPASLVKLMTAEYVFHQLSAGALSLDTEFPVSENAWRTGGAPSRTSTMFAALKSKIRVEDLLKGITVQQANDACIILAEGMAGSDTVFAGKLNERAHELGLTKSFFANSSGLPDPKNKMSVRDMVTLARGIHDNYPQYFPYYAINEFEWNKINQRNRNPLFGMVEGADGMATGYAEDSGYMIVATAERNGVRLYLAMSGLADAKEREEEARDVLEWGLTSFKRRQIFAAGETIGDVSVYGGAERHVPVVAGGPVAVFEATREPERVNGRITYHWPLKAPLKKGQPVGTLELYKGDMELQQVSVLAARDVDGGSLWSRALDAVVELLFFWL